MNDRDNDANEIDKFLEVFSLNENLIFGDATYTLNNQRHKKLRRPEQLPTEEDVTQLKEYSIQRIQDLLSDPCRVCDLHSYSELRDLVVSSYII